MSLINKNLFNELKLANDAYAKGNPFISDTEYDVLWKNCHALDPSHKELYHTARDPNLVDSIPHMFPIMGTQKAFDMNDLKPFLTRFKAQPLVVQPKYDGLAAMVYPQVDGSFKMVLYGNGLAGRDISHHIPSIDVSHLKRSRSRKFTSIELLIPQEKWNPSWGKNPRNTASGWVNRTLIPYPNILTAIPHEDHFAELILTPPYDLSNLEDILLVNFHEWNKVYPMDGLMLKVQDTSHRAIVANNGTVNLWSIAWKPPIQTSWTTVEDIQWNVSRTGRVVPKIKYEPLDLCGTINRYVTGNNAKWLLDRDISIGCDILIGKAGEIIPKILDVRNTNVPKLPIDCPMCGATLVHEGVDLICTASNCVAQQIKRLAYFYSDKGIEVKSIGEAMIELLLQDPSILRTLEKSPWALLEPDTFNLYPKINRIWGEARTETFLDNIANVSNTKNPAHFIAALGYKNLAYKTALACFQAFTMDVMPKRNIKNSVQSFTFAIADFKQAMFELNYFKLLPLPNIADKTYCITGTLSVPRNDMIAWLTSFNYQSMNQVSKNIDFLLLGELNKDSTKLKKARDLNVPIYLEHELAQLLQKEDQNGQYNNKADSRD